MICYSAHYSLTEIALRGECRGFYERVRVIGPGRIGTSSWASGEADFLPQLLPMPNAVGALDWQPIAKLVRKHNDLAAVMRFVRKHVCKHRPTRGPGLRPTATGKLRHTPLGTCRQRIGEHSQALRSAFLERGRRLLHRAAVGIERRRTFQVRHGIPQPREATVVKVREDCSDGSAAALLARGLRSPRARIEVRKDELIHRIICGVRLNEDIANFGKGPVSANAGHLLRLFGAGAACNRGARLFGGRLRM